MIAVLVTACVAGVGCGGGAALDAAETGTAADSPSPTASPTSAVPTTPSVPLAPNPALDQPLLDAARAGDVATVSALLAQGARVTATDSRGATPLVLAAYGNHVDAARVLVGAGADVNVKDDTQQSAYLIAASEVGDDPRLLELTIAHGAVLDDKDSFNGTGLIRAADRGHVEILRRLLATGAIPVNHINRLGWTALHEAVILGDGGPRYVESVRLLIAGGADVNLPSQRDGAPPLRHARDKGFTEIASVLEQAGARA